MPPVKATKTAKPKLTPEAKIVRVAIPTKSLYDIEHVTAALKGVLEKLGCRACCSGFDIRLNNMMDYVVDVEKSGVQVRGAAIQKP